MAEDQPSLHIDTDWKKQAQEEKRRLAEKTAQEAQAKAAAPSAGPSLAAGTAPADPRAAGAAPGARSAPGRGTRERRELPPASIATLAQSLMTQALYYLGDVAYQGGDPVANLDMAKHQIDTLGVIEEKTEGRLSDEERQSLDQALFETRNRFVSVASQFI
jgi:hypothetical protein